MSTSAPAPKKTSYGLKAWFGLASIKLIGCLPLKLARGLGATVALCAWAVKESSSRTTLRNLALCFPQLPQSERYALARRSMIETGKLAAEICVIQHRDAAWLSARIVKIHGEELLHTQTAKGTGCIVLAPHIGNWEIFSQLLPRYGKLTALYQPPKQAYLEELIKTSRQKTGATLVPTNRRGVAALLKSVRSGGITAILPDQNPRRGFGEFSPFYGIPAYTMTTVHGFIQRSQCAAVFGVVKRVPEGFEVYFFPPPRELYDEDLATSLAALNKGVEQCVAYCPEQYQWEYRRFKKRPQGEAPLYEDR